MVTSRADEPRKGLIYPRETVSKLLFTESTQAYTFFITVWILRTPWASEITVAINTPPHPTQRRHLQPDEDDDVTHPVDLGGIWMRI